MNERTYPDRPMAGVGAILVRGDRVLLVKRAQEPLLGKWSLPGGLIELGETARQAVSREVREETGLEVTNTRLVESVDRIYRDAKGEVEYHFVLLDFLCQSGAGEPRPSSDVSEVAWANEFEAAEMGVAESTLAVVRRALKMAGEGKG